MANFGSLSNLYDNLFNTSFVASVEDRGNLDALTISINGSAIIDSSKNITCGSITASSTVSSNANVLYLNANASGVPSTNAYIQVARGSQTNASLQWVEQGGYFACGLLSREQAIITTDLAQTMTNKTLTNPIINTINGLSLPSSSFVGITDTQTLSNKTLANVVVQSNVNLVDGSSVVDCIINNTGITPQVIELAPMSYGTAPFTISSTTMSTNKIDGTNIYTGLTANTVPYANSLKQLASSSTLTYDGTNLAATNFNGKLNNITLSGTSSTTFTFPSTSDTVATLTANQNFTNSTFNTIFPFCPSNNSFALVRLGLLLL